MPFNADDIVALHEYMGPLAVNEHESMAGATIDYASLNHEWTQISVPVKADAKLAWTLLSAADNMQWTRILAQK